MSETGTPRELTAEDAKRWVNAKRNLKNSLSEYHKLVTEFDLWPTNGMMVYIDQFLFQDFSASVTLVNGTVHSVSFDDTYPDVEDPPND